MTTIINVLTTQQLLEKIRSVKEANLQQEQPLTVTLMTHIQLMTTLLSTPKINLKIGQTTAHATTHAAQPNQENDNNLLNLYTFL